MNDVMSGGRSFNHQLTAQIRDGVRRFEAQATELVRLAAERDVLRVYAQEAIVHATKDLCARDKWPLQGLRQIDTITRTKMTGAPLGRKRPV